MSAKQDPIADYRHDATRNNNPRGNKVMKVHTLEVPPDGNHHTTYDSRRTAEYAR